MIEWHKIDQEVPDKEFVIAMKVKGKKLCLVRHQGEFFALQSSCPHAGGNLTNGWCEQGQLICPVHRWRYDLKTGRGDKGQGDCVRLYPVEHRADGLYVGLKRGFWKSLFG